MTGELLAVGVSHRTAGLALRERLAFHGDELAQAARNLVALPSVAEAMLVSTCNRVEVFATAASSTGSSAAVAEIGGYLARARGVSLEELSPALSARAGREAVRHILRVASSLDSLVVGEPEIISQLKTAYAAAVDAGCTGPTLDRCLQHAFSVAKRVRTETRIARGAASVPSAAVELARRIFGDLGGRSVLVVGAGKMADLAARNLALAGVGQVLVVNRSSGPARALAERIGGEAKPLSELGSLLVGVDVVVTSTGSPRPLVDRALMVRTMKARKGRPVFIVDIAVPRDVEPSAGDLDGVFLYDLDHLEGVVKRCLAERGGEADEAERIVEEEVSVMVRWFAMRPVVPTIRELRERFLEVAHVEAERTVTYLECRSRPLDDRQEWQVRRMAETIVKKLLHSPLAALGGDGGPGGRRLATAAQQLFDLAGGKGLP